MTLSDLAKYSMTRNVAWFATAELHVQSCFHEQNLAREPFRSNKASNLTILKKVATTMKHILEL